MDAANHGLRRSSGKRPGGIAIGREGIKKLQRDWIGRSTGAEVDFYVGDGRSDFAWWQATRRCGAFRPSRSDDVLRIYTTRPDTLYGATYMVIAPEHPVR